MTIGSLTRQLARAGLAALMLSSTALVAGAQSAQSQNHDDHANMKHRPGPQDAALVKAVRDATDKYRRVSDAMAAGYVLQFGCVSGGDFGAMGLHFVNGPLVGDGEITPEKPEIILFEPLPNGGARITGADYLVMAADWKAKHPDEGPPQLMGQLFHFFDSPNRFGLDPFYALHVWAWKDNPEGTFTNWNPNVSCDAFNPPPETSGK